MICGRKGPTYEQQSAVRSSRGSHAETTSSAGLLALPYAGAWWPPTESPAESRAQRHDRSSATSCGPRGWSWWGTPPVSARQTRGQRPGSKQTRAGGEENCTRERNIKKGPEELPELQSTTAVTRPPPQERRRPPHGPQCITQREPSFSPSPGCPQACCGCATNTFKALFYF